MKKEWVDKWVKALRSGEFKQGKGVLRTENNEYCCLGVLCKIVDDNFKFDERTHLDYKIKNEVEMKDAGGYFGDLNSTDPSKYLTILNDQGNSFEEIADIIEENWENL